jgi:branched-chain amino acid aminotransferase
VLDANGFVADIVVLLFYEKDGTLYTPAKGSILPSITRATVMDICRQLDIPVVEKFFYPRRNAWCRRGLFLRHGG